MLPILSIVGVQFTETVTEVKISKVSEMKILTTQELLGTHATDCCHWQGTKFPDNPRCRFTNIQKQLPAHL